MSKLKDLCEVIVPMRDKPKMFVAEADGIPWCRIEDIQGKYLYGTTSNQFVDKETIDKMNLKVFPAGTVICACTGASIGTYAITKRDLITNQTFAGLVCGEKLYNHYLYYFVKLYTKAFVDKSVGCAQAYITRETFENIELPDIPFEKQKEIVSVLEKIDEKIVNNNAICSNLEAMAKLLYDYWFVQFDFPDENGKPYKSSGGKMVWSDELKREIPAGWENKCLSDISDYSDAKVSAKELSSHTYIGMDNLLPNMNGRTESEYTPAEGYATAFQPMDILLGNIRPYFKKIWFADIAGGASPDVLVLKPKNKEESAFIYSLLCRDQFFDYDSKGSKGSKMPRGDKDHIMAYPFAYSHDLSIEFSRQLSMLMKKIAAAYEENLQLASLRDYLLPMLMNGQVKVG